MCYDTSMTTQTGRCEQCGKVYPQFRSTSRFCSTKCRVYFNRDLKTKTEEISLSDVDVVEVKEEVKVLPPEKLKTAICEHGALREFCQVCLRQG